MRGLPPPPADFIRITVVWSFVPSASSCTNSWWLFAPGADAASPAQLTTLLGDFNLSALNSLLALAPGDASCSLLRLTTEGASPAQVEYVPGPNAGAGGPAEGLQVATVLTWRTATRARGGNAHTWVPCPRDVVDTNKVQLTTPAYSLAQSSAKAFLNQCNAIASPDGGLCVLATLRRQENSAPLPASRFDPVVDGDASLYLGTLHRRVRGRGRAPSI